MTRGANNILGPRDIGGLTAGLNIDADELNNRATISTVPDPDFIAATVGGAPLATENYVDTKWNTLGAWQAPVLSRIDSIPVTSSTGNRYLVSDASPTVPNNIIQFTSTITYDATPPIDGMVVFAQDTDYIWLYNGAAWVRLSVQVDHNTMLGLQGGTSTERYHINAATSTNLAGLSSPVQTQLDARLPLAGGALTGALAITRRSDASKKIILYDDATTEAASYGHNGFGQSANSMDYYARTGNSHNWWVATSSSGTAARNLARINANGLTVFGTDGVTASGTIGNTSATFRNTSGTVVLAADGGFGSGVIMRNTEGGTTRRFEVGIRVDGAVIFRHGNDVAMEPSPIIFRWPTGGNPSAVEIPSLSSDRVVVTNASKQLNSSAVTATELGYLAGATSNIQTQINSISGAKRMSGMVTTDISDTYAMYDIQPAGSYTSVILSGSYIGVELAAGWAGVIKYVSVATAFGTMNHRVNAFVTSTHIYFELMDGTSSTNWTSDHRLTFHAS